MGEVVERDGTGDYGDDAWSDHVRRDMRLHQSARATFLLIYDTKPTSLSSTHFEGGFPIHVILIASQIAEGRAGKTEVSLELLTLS